MVDLEKQSSDLARRIIRDLVQPYMKEHAQGRHGPADPAACMTVIMTGMAKAIVPTLVQATDIHDQGKVLEQLGGMITEHCAGFRAHLAQAEAARGTAH